MQTAPQQLGINGNALQEETSDSKFICQEDHSDSFEDLEDDSTFLHTEQGQTIIIDAEEDHSLREDRAEPIKEG